METDFHASLHTWIMQSNMTSNKNLIACTTCESACYMSANWKSLCYNNGSSII